MSAEYLVPSKHTLKILCKSKHFPRRYERKREWVFFFWTQRIRSVWHSYLRNKLYTITLPFLWTVEPISVCYRVLVTKSMIKGRIIPQTCWDLQRTQWPSWLQAAAKLAIAVHRHSQSPPVSHLNTSASFNYSLHHNLEVAIHNLR